MGMFDKDKQFAPDGRLDEVCPPGELDTRTGTEFVLFAVEDKGKFTTDIGEADMTWLTIALDKLKPDEQITVGTLSKPIAAKAAEAEPSDFPAVVRTMKVSTDQQPALVLQWIAPFGADKKGKKG